MHKPYVHKCPRVQTGQVTYRLLVTSVQPKCAYVDFLYALKCTASPRVECAYILLTTYSTPSETRKDTTYRIYRVLLNMVFNFLVRY